jgi:hypothetical protein
MIVGDGPEQDLTSICEGKQNPARGYYACNKDKTCNLIIEFCGGADSKVISLEAPLPSGISTPPISGTLPQLTASMNYGAGLVEYTTESATLDALNVEAVGHTVRGAFRATLSSQNQPDKMVHGAFRVCRTMDEFLP